MDSAFFRSIVRLSRDVLGFSDIGIFSLDSNLISDPVHISKNREIYEHLKTTTRNKHDWAKTIIVLIRPYTPYTIDFPNGYGIYSAHYKQYPNGRKSTQILESFIEDAGFHASGDSGIPVKAAAFCAGLGRYGKNSLIYTNEYGSFITIHTVVTDALFDYDDCLLGEVTDCGECNICIDICPTKAIRSDGSLIKGRCLREHMLSKNIVPLDMRKLFGKCILGCDICQIVCPKNRARYKEAVMPSDEEVKAFDIDNILSDNDESNISLDFIESIIGANYAKREQVLSTAAIIAGNMKEMRFFPKLIKLLNDINPAVRVHVAWALHEIDAKSAEVELKCAISKEADEKVKLELESLLAIGL